jgi:NAD(P) transhydrogenase subunit alpha
MQEKFAIREFARLCQSPFSLSGTTKSLTDKGMKGSMSPELLTGIVVFVLASFVGFEVINKVPPTLHTPLMSGSNAISGISIVGALLMTGAKEWSLVTILGFIAVILATINVVGGFWVTDRMLQMFKKKEAKA